MTAAREPQEPSYWVGRLAMGLAHVQARKDVTLAREPLEAFLKHYPHVPPQVREELKR